MPGPDGQTLQLMGPMSTRSSLGGNALSGFTPEISVKDDISCGDGNHRRLGNRLATPLNPGAFSAIQLIAFFEPVRIAVEMLG